MLSIQIQSVFVKGVSFPACIEKSLRYLPEALLSRRPFVQWYFKQMSWQGIMLANLLSHQLKLAEIFV
jgi:hypothetical protein